MVHHRHGKRDPRAGFTDVIAADEAAPSLPRQFAHGFGGVFLLLVAGLAILTLVLWKAP